MSAIFQSWGNQNRYRSYPFAENSDLSMLEDPDVKLPDSLVVDAAISLPVQVQSSGVRPARSAGVVLSAVMYGEPRLVFFFALETGEQIASATLSDLASHVPGTSYPVYGAGDWDDVRGSVTIGDLADLRANVPAGSYTFKDARLEMSAVRPTLRGVRSIRVGVGTALSDSLYGVVKLLEGANIKLTVLPDENAIRIDAVQTDDFKDECVCEDAAEAATRIKTVNGISAQNLSIYGDDCVEVSVEGNTIRIKDKCSFPCCGCEELDFIASRVKFLDTAMGRVESFANALNSILPASVAAMHMMDGVGRGRIETSSLKV